MWEGGRCLYTFGRINAYLVNSVSVQNCTDTRLKFRYAYTLIQTVSWNLNPFRRGNNMKSGPENEIAGKVHEVAGKNRGRSSKLARTDTGTQNHWSNKFIAFAMGAGVGALLGLLFAPASGKKTRAYVTDTLKQGLDDAASAGKRWSRSAQDTVYDVNANVAGVVAAGQKAYRTARDA